MIAWTKLTMFAAYDSTLTPTEEERIAALREWRRRGCIRDWCFDRCGGAWETDEPHTWGPQFADDVDWSGFEAVTETAWTYDGYWAAVLGANRTAEDVVREFGLDSSDRVGLDRWLGEAEGEAAAMGRIALPPEWSGFHSRALEELADE